jgi:two-component system CheB/CheR fusion protein
MAEPAKVRRVLVIDDARDVADVTVEMVKSLGHAAEAAYDGTAAMGAAVRFQPDIILVDLVMPEMDGFELVRELLSMFPSNRPRMVAYSGFKQAAFQDAAKAVGFDAYLPKPATMNELERLLTS